MKSVLAVLFFFCCAGSAGAMDLASAELRIYPLNRQDSSGKNTSRQTRQEGQYFFLGLTVTPPPNTYFYGPESVQGLPTRFQLQAETFNGTALTPSEILLPQALKKTQTVFATTDTRDSDSKTAIYPKSTTFFAKIRMPDAGGSIQTEAQGLFCTQKKCSPFHFRFTRLSLKKYQGQWFAEISAEEQASPSQHRLPPLPETPFWDACQKKSFLPLGLPDSLPPLLVLPKDSMDSAAKLDTSVPTQQIGELKQRAQNASQSVPPPHEKQVAPFSIQTFTPVYHMSALEISGLGEAVLFGLLAGLILNLMPCVLPVISLKFSTLLAVSTMRNKEEQARLFRLHSLFFALGILCWFLFLALMLGLAGWVWGELFQQPKTIGLIGLLFFVLALSMFNVFSLPILNVNPSTKRPHQWQSFVSGIFATLLATPCSGPLLGGVIGWAVRQSLPSLMSSILAVGLGMASPYVAMVISPRLIHLLPKPGAWTLRLEQAVGFFLLAGSAYFMLILPPEWYPGYIIILLGIAFSAWLWGQIGNPGASRPTRMSARLLAIFIIALTVFCAENTLHRDTQWETFNLATLENILGKEAVLLEFTADWCPNCKVLEQMTLNQKRMNRLRKRYKLRTIKADLTQHDKPAQMLLEALGSKSLPLIAVFPKGANAAKPLILRDMVTPGQLEAALEELFSKKETE